MPALVAPSNGANQTLLALLSGNGSAPPTHVLLQRSLLGGGGNWLRQEAPTSPSGKATQGHDDEVHLVPRGISAPSCT